MTKRSHGDGSISIKPNGSWLAQVSLCGHRLSRVFKTYSQADEWVNETNAQVCGDAHAKRQKKINKKIDLISKENNDGKYQISLYSSKARLKKYKLTLDQYESILESQGGRCAICNIVFTQTPHIDHDHLTGKVRGILCRNCNHALGLIGDSPMLALGLAKYLIEHEARGIPWCRLIVSQSLMSNNV